MVYNEHEHLWDRDVVGTLYKTDNIDLCYYSFTIGDRLRRPLRSYPGAPTGPMMRNDRGKKDSGVAWDRQSIRPPPPLRRRAGQL